jgi:hypothetical protein
MKKYKLINNVTGWVVFAIAAFTYLATIEPTASLWDCGEFIASGYKLEVGHPPGNPVFMIMANFFSNLAHGNTSRIAAMVNSMSALASAFTILFLFWTITHLARKILARNDEEYTTPRVIAIMGAGVVGALAYTFSDSFWFSAVEGEVYASSSFFTAIVFWAILKWEDAADEPHGDRWIILIAYLMGLSIGVHLLNLLTIPAMGLVYYFRKFQFSWKGFGISIAVSFIMLALLMWGIMPGVITISSKFDYFFVNTLHLPANSGMLLHVIILGLLLSAGIWFSRNSESTAKNALVAIAALFFTGIWIISGSAVVNLIILAAVGAVTAIWLAKSQVVMNVMLTCILVIMIGYSSMAIIVIRSSAGTPLNEDNPSNPFNLLYFINREQYGERPLVKGQYYNAPVVDYKNGKPGYALENGKYVITHYNLERVYDERFFTIFPRMYSDQPDHMEVYKEWGGPGGMPMQVTDNQGKKSTVRKPTFGQNMRFFLDYQMNYMYFRYFMWNFAGKQNDTQGTGGAINGNWITGLKFIDEHRVGTPDLPSEEKNDPARNVYYLLPLLFGLFGFFYQLNRDNKNWWVVLLLFIMTGLAIVVYLNQYPNQPRERDYAYAGSFYFFAVWIGLGVLFIFELLSKLSGEEIAAPVAGIVSCLAVPFIMGTQNWDDHDRSGRYLTRDVAFNYLESCAPNSILFTNGDNDTFPLWYAQEVEGKRTDIRVCNLMLLNTDWYIDQMKLKTYTSDQLPVSLPTRKYYDGVNNQIFIIDKIQGAVDISTAIDFIKSDNPGLKVKVSETETLDILPTRTLRIPVDRAKVLASGTVKAEDSALIVPYIDVKLKGSSILKSQLIVLDILAHNDWKRPIYFVTGYHNDACGLEEYFQLEGLAYRFVPIKSHNTSWVDYGRIDADILYNNMMKKFAWGGANDPKVDIDYNHRRTLLVVRARLNYAKLANALTMQGKMEKANEVLDYCMKTFPLSKIPYDPYMNDIIEAYFNAGNSEKGISMTRDMWKHYVEELDYWLKQRPYVVKSAEYEVESALQYSSRAANTCIAAGQPELGKEINSKIESYLTTYFGVQKKGVK